MKISIPNPKPKTHGPGFWILMTLIMFGVVLLIKSFTTLIPLHMFELWWKGDIYGGVIASRIIFMWGAFVTAFVAFLTFNDPKKNIYAELYLAQGVITSVLAGIVEEILFRWLIFYFAMASASALNSIFMAVFGQGVVEWFYVKAMFPALSFISFGKLDWLVKDMPWLVAAGAVIANAKFRSAHSYLGFFGWLNSWIVGFFLFWIVFNYGMWAAIISHFLYDLIIFSIAYVDAVLERSAGIVYQPSNP